MRIVKENAATGEAWYQQDAFVNTSIGLPDEVAGFEWHREGDPLDSYWRIYAANASRIVAVCGTDMLHDSEIEQRMLGLLEELRKE